MDVPVYVSPTGCMYGILLYSDSVLPLIRGKG